MQVICMLFTGLVLCAINVVAGYSVILGAAIYSIPAYWAWQRECRCRKTGGTSGNILIRMYSNEVAKFLFTLALFVLAFGLVKPLNALVLLLAYIASQLLAVLLQAISSVSNSS
jgi:F0F1-type ATP synthase assembly protein I